MRIMLDDLRYALRTFVRNPAFAAVAILTIAVGIGASIAVFSLVNAILLRPLAGVADPGRLVSFYRVLKTDSFDNLGYPDYADYRDRNQSFSGLAAHCPAMISLSFRGAERVSGDLVTENYFDVLGVKPAIGSLALSGNDSSVVISQALWERKFGRAPDVIGTRITLNGSPFIIGGVAARGFRGTAVNEAFDVWAPLEQQPKLLSRLSPGILQDRAAGWIQVFGRMKSGVGIRQAQAEMTALSAQLKMEAFRIDAGAGGGKFRDVSGRSRRGERLARATFLRRRIAAVDRLRERRGIVSGARRWKDSRNRRPVGRRRQPRRELSASFLRKAGCSHWPAAQSAWCFRDGPPLRSYRSLLAFRSYGQSMPASMAVCLPSACWPLWPPAHASPSRQLSNP